MAFPRSISFLFFIPSLPLFAGLFICLHCFLILTYFIPLLRCFYFCLAVSSFFLFIFPVLFSLITVLSFGILNLFQRSLYSSLHPLRLCPPCLFFLFFSYFYPFFFHLFVSCSYVRTYIMNCIFFPPTPFLPFLSLFFHPSFR